MDQFRRVRQVTALLWVVLFAGLALTTTSNRSFAQEGEQQPAQEQAAAPASDNGGESAAPQQQRFLVYMFKASPTFFVIMLALSLFFLSTAVSNYNHIQMGKVIPKELIGQLDALLNEKNYKEAYEVVRGNQSLFARALTSGVERLSHGFDRGVDAMVSVAEDGKLDMEHKVSPIATIGTVAPMLGLLGTVIGMVLAFQEIAAGGQPKPAELAENIGLALVTTLEGIVVAVPAIAAFAFFRNRISRLIFEVESLGEAYLWRFAGALKKS